MNSFDSLIEKYSKELIEAKSRSILQAIDEVLSDEALVVEANADLKIDEDNRNMSENRLESEVYPIKSEPDKNGKLKVQVFAADRVYPISSALVSVYETKTDNRLFQGYTNSSGEVGNIFLPAPSKVSSEAPSNVKPYYQYDIVVSYPRFISRKYIGAPIFEGIETIQSVQLVPTEKGDNMETTVVESEPNNLLLGEGREVFNG